MGASTQTSSLKGMKLSLSPLIPRLVCTDTCESNKPMLTRLVLEMSFFFFPFFPFLLFKCWGIISAWIKHKTEHNPVINQSTFYTAAFLERQLKDLSLQFQTNILWHALEIELIIIKRGTLSVRGGSWKRDVLVNSVLNKLSWVLLDRKIMRERRKVIKNAASLI